MRSCEASFDWSLSIWTPAKDIDVDLALVASPPPRLRNMLLVTFWSD